MKCFPNHIRHWQHVECAKWAMPKCSYWLLERYFRESSAYGQKQTAQNWPPESDRCRLATFPLKKNKIKRSHRFIEEVTTELTLLLALGQVHSGAFSTTFIVQWSRPQLLQETHSHQDLVKSHHTLYGHTNERTTIQISMKCFPNGNIEALTKIRNNNSYHNLKKPSLLFFYGSV